VTDAAKSISVSCRGKLGSFALDATFDVPMKGITAIFGPSGCGKTTVLRCMAGLQRLGGHVRIGDEVWQDEATFRQPFQRHVGYVFQEPSLFPHLSVRDNLLFGARRVRDVDSNFLSFDDVVTLLGIGHLLDRATTVLSGGERQRIAVGRALLAQPRLLLMDEPLSALDKLSKDEILPTFELLHERLAVPIVYISHDFTEVERLADTLVLMEKGRVLACGPIGDLQLDPELPLLAAPEAAVVLDGIIGGFDWDFQLTEIMLGAVRLMVPGMHGSVGERRRLRISSSDVSLARSEPSGSTIINTLPVVVTDIEVRPDAPQAQVIVALGADDGAGAPRIAARVTRKSIVALDIKVGDRIFAQIKSVALASSRTVRPS